MNVRKDPIIKEVTRRVKERKQDKTEWEVKGWRVGRKDKQLRELQRWLLNIKPFVARTGEHPFNGGRPIHLLRPRWITSERSWK